MHVLHTMEAFASIVDLQERIWGMARQDTVSPYIMNAMIHNGGSVIAAEVDGQMVGFCLGFAGKREDEVLLWSHMAGVLPAYQGRKIGFLLKQAQRNWALEYGYDTICWTFDPLQRGNARFNFRYLGVTAHVYHVNLYGEMTDAINAGLASDRLEAHWNLNDARVVALAEGAASKEYTENFPDDAFLVQLNSDAIVLCKPDVMKLDAYCIEIPYDLSTLKTTNKLRAIEWQLAIRQAMVFAFEKGYSADEFILHDGRCWYVMRKN